MRCRSKFTCTYNILNLYWKWLGCGCLGWQHADPPSSLHEPRRMENCHRCCKFFAQLFSMQESFEILRFSTTKNDWCCKLSVSSWEQLSFKNPFVSSQEQFSFENPLLHEERFHHLLRPDYLNSLNSSK